MVLKVELILPKPLPDIGLGYDQILALDVGLNIDLMPFKHRKFSNEFDLLESYIEPSASLIGRGLQTCGYVV